MIMEKSDEGRRYRWTNGATNLLVSIWSNDKVQNQLRQSTRNQPLWDSIANCMSQKGFPVTGLQCRTRIKNMLCTYHYAVKKNDPSIIEPFYDIFRKTLRDKSTKKKDKVKMNKIIKQEEISDDSDMNDIDTSQEPDGSYDVDQSQSAPDSGYSVEYLESQETPASGSLNNTDMMVQLEKIIVKAMDTQSKTIAKVIKSQTQIIEKLLVAERERLEIIMASERESRKQLETRLDRLLLKLESSPTPQFH